MKKIVRIITPLFIVAALLAVPLGVQAQVIDIPADDEDESLLMTDFDTDPLPSTGAETPTPVAAPDTGFGPSENKVVANLSVFMIGSLLGASLGYGAIVLKKKFQL